MEISNFPLNQCVWLRLIFVSMFSAWQASLAWAQLSKELIVNFVRLAWPYKNKLEVSAVVQKLLKHRDIEVEGIKIPRRVYGRATWRY